MRDFIQKYYNNNSQNIDQKISEFFIKLHNEIQLCETKTREKYKQIKEKQKEEFEYNQVDLKIG